MRAKWFTRPGKMTFATIVVGASLSSAAMFIPLNAVGQEKIVPPPNPAERFQIERQADGLVRVDKKTGETSYCRRVIDSFVCTLAIEERDTLHNEIANLQNKLSALQEKLDVAGSDEPSQRRPKDDVPDPSPDPNFDDDAGFDQDKIEKEMDRAIEFTKLTMRKLFKAVKELQKEFQEEGTE